MRSQAILLLLCFIACAYAQLYTCQVNTCVKAGEICNSNGTIGCRSDAQCISSSYDTGLCMERPRLGDSCVQSSSSPDCETGTDCVSSGDNYICGLNQPNTGYLFPGEGCNDDMQCDYNSPYGSGTDDSRDLCRSGKCHHVKRGDYCSGSRQCNYNSDYCGRDQRCTKYIKEGAACFFNDETGQNDGSMDISGCGKDHEARCMPNGLSGQAGTCRKTQSRDEEDYCRYDSDCKKGLFCLSSRINPYGTCKKPITSATLNVACNPILGSSACTSDNAESCTCTKEGLTKCLLTVDDGEYRAYEDLVECIRKKGCTGTSDFTCVKDKCKSQACKYYKNAKKGDANVIDCAAEGLCNSAFTLVASPVLALLAIVAVFVL